MVLLSIMWQRNKVKPRTTCIVYPSASESQLTRKPQHRPAAAWGGAGGDVGNPMMKRTQSAIVMNTSASYSRHQRRTAATTASDHHQKQQHRHCQHHSMEPESESTKTERVNFVLSYTFGEQNDSYSNKYSVHDYMSDKKMYLRRFEEEAPDNVNLDVHYKQEAKKRWMELERSKKAKQHHKSSNNLRMLPYLTEQWKLQHQSYPMNHG